jgi:CO dehydrogenase maturation factor
MIIAVSGKGGVGKTMLSALLVKVFSDEVPDLLAIDADPDSNLPEALGVNVGKTIGDVREEILEARNRSPGRTLHDVLEYHVLGTIEETDNFDLLAMGRPEGSGCYCAVNQIVVTDTSKRGIETAKRIKELASELDIEFKKLYVVINRTRENMLQGIKKELAEAGLEVLGAIPEDKNVLEFDYEGKPLTKLPPDSPALKEVTAIKKKLSATAL